VVLSAANAGLYVASRTLFGLTRKIDRNASFPMSAVRRLGWVTKGTEVRGFGVIFGKIPAPSIFFSVLCFCWIPFIHLSKHDSIAEVEQVLSDIGTVGCLLVWASQTLAYIRFNMFRSRYNREDLEKNKSWGQPLWAWLGLILCLAIVLILNTASWWSDKINPKLDSAPRLLSTYIGPIALFLIWIFLKLIHWGRSRPETTAHEFNNVIDRLNRMAAETEDTSEEQQGEYGHDMSTYSDQWVTRPQEPGKPEDVMIRDSIMNEHVPERGVDASI